MLTKTFITLVEKLVHAR